MKLNELVDHIFPSLTVEPIVQEYSDFTFWKPTFPAITEIDLPKPVLKASADLSSDDEFGDDDDQSIRSDESDD